MTHVFCGMLEYLRPCSTINAAVRAHCRFPVSHSSLQSHSSRDSSDLDVTCGTFGISSIVFRTQAVHSACCLQPSFRKLTVRLLTFSASAVVLAPAFCFVCCRTLVSLSATSLTACLNYGFSAFRFCGFLRCNRPGFFIGLVLLNCLLHLLLFLCCCSSSEFLTVCTLSFNSAALCSFVAFLAIFCIGVTSHRRDSLDSVSALTWFSHSSCSSPSTPRPSMDVYLNSSRSSQSRACR